MGRPITQPPPRLGRLGNTIADYIETRKDKRAQLRAIIDYFSPMGISSQNIIACLTRCMENGLILEHPGGDLYLSGIARDARAVKPVRDPNPQVAAPRESLPFRPLNLANHPHLRGDYRR